MTYDEFIRTYWHYYLSLENKFIDTINYVELCEDNFNTYSNTYIMLLQAIGSELNALFKELCHFDKSENKNIKDFVERILNDFPEIVEFEIKVIGYDISFKPFKGWNVDRPSKSLEWWEAYNQIKHNRIESIKVASLKNVIYSLSGLMLLNMKLCKDIYQTEQHRDNPKQRSSLFQIVGWDFKHVSLGDDLEAIITKVNDN